MFWKVLSCFAFCAALSAADLPDGWTFYNSTDKKAPAGAKSTVTFDGTAIRIVDPGAGVEGGITKKIPCTPGDYFRLTVDFKDPNPKYKSKISVSGYYMPKVKQMAANTMLQPDKTNVILIGPVPEGVKALRLYVYSRRPVACDAQILFPKLETSKTPFAAK